jgi:hypothetical protein
MSLRACMSVGSTAIEGMPGTLDKLQNPRAFLTCQYGENVPLGDREDELECPEIVEARLLW